MPDDGFNVGNFEEEKRGIPDDGLTGLAEEASMVASISHQRELPCVLGRLYG